MNRLKTYLNSIDIANDTKDNTIQCTERTLDVTFVNNNAFAVRIGKINLAANSTLQISANNDECFVQNFPISFQGNVGIVNVIMREIA